jgi:NADPH:quinone reductase-like Zn-dependent oxidoreductase
MKAWQVPELGEPRDVLRLAEVPDPVPGPGQVLVRVLAAAANFPDVLMCRGGYQVRPPLPYIPGIELCGEVVAAGPEVTGVAPGDRLIGGPIGGAFAELTLMNAATALPAPDGLDDAEAAAFFVTYQTGWFGLHRRARLAAGETLLVHAAAGGVGSGAVQLGKAAGARVIGVAGGERKAEAARALGADVVIDRNTQDFVEVVKGVTEGRGADVIYDPVGGDTYAPVHQVHRVRGPDPGHRLRRRADPVGRAEPRAGQELLDRGAALGPVPEQEPPAHPRLSRPADHDGGGRRHPAAGRRAAGSGRGAGRVAAAGRRRHGRPGCLRPLGLASTSSLRAGCRYRR